MGQGRERDLNPAIVHDGLVIVAPDDAPEIYAFDAATGRLAWKTDPIPEEVKLTHLLGVAKGYLIATGDRVLWFDVKTGKLAHAWPDNAQAVQGFGRGILAGDQVYWPTQTEIHVLDQASGLEAEPPIKLQETYQCEGGNLAVGDGYLIVAQANSLVVFCQNSRLIDRYRDEIARAPEQAVELLPAGPGGRGDRPRRGGPGQPGDGPAPGPALGEHRRRPARRGDPRPPAAAPDEAGPEGPAGQGLGRGRPAVRGRRRGRPVRPRPARGPARTGRRPARPGRARGVGRDPPGAPGRRADAGPERRRRRRPPIGPRRPPDRRPAGRAAPRQGPRPLRRLRPGRRRPAGPGPAREGPAAPGGRRPELPGRPGSSPRPGWPWASSTTSSHRPGDAARAYKRLLAVAPDDATRARALWGLARAYEAQKLWVSARDAYLQALDAVRRPAGRATRARLGRASWSPTGWPASRSTGWSATAPSRACRSRSAADGTADGPRPPARSPPRGSRPRPRRAGSSWSRAARSARSTRPRASRPGRATSKGEPVWVGYLADRIIAATRTRLVALSLDKGAVEWQYDLGVGTTAKGGANPFAREPAAEAGPATPPRRTLQDFRIVGNRIFCLRGDQALMAFDGDSGLLDWSYTPAAGPDQPAPAGRPPADRAPGPQAERGPGARHRHRPPPGRVPPGRGGGVAPRPAADRRRPRRAGGRPDDRRPVRHRPGGQRLGLPARPRTSPSTARPGSSATPSGSWSSTTAAS